MSDIEITLNFEIIKHRNSNDPNFDKSKLVANVFISLKYSCLLYDKCVCN